MRKLLLGLAAVLAACGAVQTAESPVTPGPPTTIEPTTGDVSPSPGTGPDATSTSTTVGEVASTTTKLQHVTSPPSSAFDPSLQTLVDLASSDLAARLSVDTGSIAVLLAEAVVWPDGSLGCPQPGMVYTQVQVEGARIVLQVSGVAYPYHSGGGRLPFLCEKG